MQLMNMSDTLGLPGAKLTRADLVDLNAFVAVARTRSFTRAGIELGVTASALSHAIRHLETRLGVRLFNRTSRTVVPTPVGEALAARLALGFNAIGEALLEVNQHRDRPVGRLRLNVLNDGSRLLLNRALPSFLERYPEMDVEVEVNDQMVDIVAAGFDAGIRFGGTVPEDLIALPIGDALRWVAVASPRYLNRHPPIHEPDDLKQHQCIRLRTGAGVIYRWDFRKDDQHRVVDVPGRLCVNETTLAIDMALAGRGIAYCLEARVMHWLERGELQRVLPHWAPLEPAFHIYYPGRRQMPAGLREFVEVLREVAARR